jgi:hypothetical protein
MFSSYPQNLVQVAFDAYNAPIQSQILQEDLTLKKQEVVAQQMALQNQVGLQQDMQKIWGSGGITAGIEAGANPSDPAQMPKLMATAASLFSHGQPQAGGSFLSSMSMLGYRQAETQKYQQQVQWRKAQEVGSALGAVTDQTTYDVALAKIRAEGIDPVQYGMSGDYNTDAPKLPALAQMAMSRAQQLQAQDRETAHSDLQFQRDISNGFTQSRLDSASRRLDIAQGMADLRKNQVEFQQTEAGKRDARAQEGLDLRKLEHEDRSFANASRLQKPENDIAQGVFGTDVRTANLPPALQKSLATLAARRAKQQIAHDMMGSGDTEYEPEDFGSALAHQMDQMQRQGMFQVEGGGMFGGDGGTTFNPPKGAPVARPKPSGHTAPPQKAEGNKLEQMNKDPRAMDIKQKVQDKLMSTAEGKKELAKLGY